MDENRSTAPDITPEKLRIMKIAFSVALVAIAYLGYSGIVSTPSNDPNDANIMPFIFGFMGLMTSGMAVWFSQKARRGPLAQATIASAQFEIATILAFIHSIITTDSPQWLVPAVAIYSIICIWIIVPSKIEKSL